jgi:hypothetical protein
VFLFWSGCGGGARAFSLQGGHGRVVQSCAQKFCLIRSAEDWCVAKRWLLLNVNGFRFPHDPRHIQERLMYSKTQFIGNQAPFD